MKIVTAVSMIILQKAVLPKNALTVKMCSFKKFTNKNCIFYYPENKSDGIRSMNVHWSHSYEASINRNDE